MGGFVRPALMAACTLFAVNTAKSADLFAPEAAYGFFGSVSGSYILESGLDDWTFIGFVPQDYSSSGLGDGWQGNLQLGYRWSAWDAAVAFQYADLGSGDPSVTQAAGPPLNEGSLSAEHWAVDAEIGYNFDRPGHRIRLSGGVRFAAWDNTVDTFWPGAGIPVNGPVHHDFFGVGPVIKLDGSAALGNGAWSLEYGLAASVLFGDIETYTNNPAYDCTSCTDTDTTAYSLKGEIGLGFDLSDSARGVIGWRAEYWGDVNVEITDTDFFGNNSGTSGHLLTGPFLRVSF